jgi:hypothetical protein
MSEAMVIMKLKFVVVAELFVQQELFCPCTMLNIIHWTITMLPKEHLHIVAAKRYQSLPRTTVTIVTAELLVEQELSCPCTMLSIIHWTITMLPKRHLHIVAAKDYQSLTRTMAMITVERFQNQKTLLQTSLHQRIMRRYAEEVPVSLSGLSSIPLRKRQFTAKQYTLRTIICTRYQTLVETEPRDL